MIPVSLALVAFGYAIFESVRAWRRQEYVDSAFLLGATWATGVAWALHLLGWFCR